MLGLSEDAGLWESSGLGLSTFDFLSKLPKKIIAAIPRARLKEILVAIDSAVNSWKNEVATPDANGMIEIPKGIGLLSYGITERVKFDTCEPWKLGIKDGIASPLSLLAHIYFEKQPELIAADKHLRFHEYFSIALVNAGPQSQLPEVARFHAWIANFCVNHLLRLYTGRDDLSHANPLAVALEQELRKQQESEYKKFQARIEKSTRKTNHRVLMQVVNQANNLFAKYRTWSINRIAQEILETNGSTDLPKLTQLRNIIAKNCPNIPKQKAGRPRKKKVQ
jgi:hypothetical protein